MNIPQKYLQNGFSMPVFGLGTWGMGGKFERDEQNNDAGDIAAIQRAIDAGITHIDTAEGYANGYTETLVGKAIQKHDRKRLFLVSKVKKENLRYDDLLKSCHQSLERLQTDYLDLYLIHSPSIDIPISESMAALDELKNQGLIKNIGVSNFTIERFTEAQAHCQNPIVANQLHYNLHIREAERRGLVSFCQTHDVMFIAWRPVQKGMLAANDIPLIQALCKKYRKTPAQIAINWLISQPHVVTMSKMNSSQHLEENLGALGWEMDAADIEDLRQNFPNQSVVSDSVPLR